MKQCEQKFVKKKHLTLSRSCSMLSQVIEMERIVEQGFLYDFYGVLLTAHQREIYEDVVFHDFSVSEIAREQGISRQGVHDMIKRCDRILKDYEEKLKLVEKFMKTRRMVEEIHGLTKEFKKSQDQNLIRQIEQISDDILNLG